MKRVYPRDVNKLKLSIYDVNLGCKHFAVLICQFFQDVRLGLGLLFDEDVDGLGNGL